MIRGQSHAAKPRTQILKLCKTLESAFDRYQLRSWVGGIDELLAKHYGFTEEELDFIINYDIKYPPSRSYGGQAAGATSSTRSKLSVLVKSEKGKSK